MLNHDSVDTIEIEIFQDRRGGFKTSYVLLDFIFTRRRNEAEKNIDVFSDQCRLKPNAIVLTSMNAISMLDNN